MTFLVPIPNMLRHAKQVAKTAGFENVRLSRIGFAEWQASAKLKGVNEWWSTLGLTRRQAIADLIAKMESRKPNDNLVN